MDNVEMRIDIDELMSKLKAMEEDDYVTVEISIVDEGYYKYMEVKAIGLEEDTSYGTLQEVDGELW